MIHTAQKTGWERPKPSSVSPVIPVEPVVDRVSIEIASGGVVHILLPGFPLDSPSKGWDRRGIINGHRIGGRSRIDVANLCDHSGLDQMRAMRKRNAGDL